MRFRLETVYNHTTFFNAPSVLAYEDNKCYLALKESIFKRGDYCSIKRKISSLQLYLFAQAWYFNRIKFYPLKILFILVACNFMMESRNMFLTTPSWHFLARVSNRNTRTRCKICSKLTIKTLKQGLKYIPT